MSQIIARGAEGTKFDEVSATRAEIGDFYVRKFFTLSVCAYCRIPSAIRFLIVGGFVS